MNFPSIASVFGPKPAPIVAPSPTLASTSAADRAAALSVRQREIADELAARHEELQRHRLFAEKRAAQESAAAIDAAEVTRAALASALSTAFYVAVSPIVAAFRASGTRDHAEALRLLLIDHLARVALELGAVGRVHVVGFAFARAQGRLCASSILTANSWSDVGMHVDALRRFIDHSGAFADALAKLDRCVEAAPVNGTLERFDAHAECMTDLDEGRVLERQRRAA